MSWIKRIFNRKIDIGDAIYLIKRKIDVDKLNLGVEHWTSISSNATTRAIDDIFDLMQRRNISLEEALYTQEGKDILFQLLLHKHWVGFNIELLRQVKAHQDANIPLNEYTEKIEKSVATNSMNILLTQFIEEIKPYLRECLGPEYGEHTEPRA